MCRLFGMSGGEQRVKATFWLLEAHDSLAQQSRREPDGTGIGWFDANGQPHVAKQPIAAFEDEEFAREARELESRTFVAHVRYATTGAVQAQNTHPFEQRGRLFAMDEDAGWRLLDSGELVHVSLTLAVESTLALDGPPALRLST
jgi:predicted glutamine amidotransferase